MKRKMIILAFGWKCGALGFIGLSDGSANSFSFRRAERASAPIPKPLCAKKCRRVTSFKTSSCLLISNLISASTMKIPAPLAIRRGAPGRPYVGRPHRVARTSLFLLRTCRLLGRFLHLSEVGPERPDTMHLDDGLPFRPREMPHLLGHQAIASRLQFMAGVLVEFLSGSHKETSLMHGQVLVL